MTPCNTVRRIRNISLLRFHLANSLSITLTNDNLPWTSLLGHLIGSPGLIQADPPYYEDNDPGDVAAALLCLVLVPTPIPVAEKKFLQKFPEGYGVWQ